jgi:hypothetical protein
MKLLMIYCSHFSYQPSEKSWEEAQEVTEGAQWNEVQLAMIQVEEEDEAEGRSKAVERNLLNFTKWIARKNNTKKVVLHSFAHLSESKASPQFTQILFDRVEQRLRLTGHEVAQTPFGYFLHLHIDAPGFSLARVFKSFD